MLEEDKKKVFVGYSGCKVNQFEKNFLEERFIEKGFEIVSDYRSANIIVFNTCCVTKKSENGCRQQIRKIVRENNSAKVIVTGCYAHKDGEFLKQSLSVSEVFNNEEKFSIPEILIGEKLVKNSTLDFEYKRVFKERSRAFLKIQDGCDSFCSYCIVPYVRGLPKSMPKDTVLKNLENLKYEGEVVLTGIHLGKWGIDIGENLKNLLREISRRKFNFRLRLSSLEPVEVDKELLNILKDIENFCPHFHIPLQSGSNRILKLMNRKYSTSFYKEIIDLIREYFPMAGVGLDIIVGFPTETDEDFFETKEFLTALSIDYMHIFRYSDRNGTHSYSFKPKIAEEVKEKRIEILKEIDRNKREKFYERFLNKEVNCLFDRKKNGVNRFVTREYLKVYSENINNEKEFTAKVISINPPIIETK